MQKKPVLLLAGPRPSSLYRYAKLFAVNGISSSTFFVAESMSEDTTSNDTFFPWTDLLNPYVGISVLTALNLYC
jgi:hypothetical protein